MVELEGSLNGISLPVLVRLVCELHPSGSLELANGASSAVLGLDNRRVVAAECDRRYGLEALAICARELSNAEFRFVKGVPAGERTLNLDPDELQREWVRIAHIEASTRPEPPASAAAEQLSVKPGVCPYLGFADNQSRHYFRASALHHCYASPVSSPVTGEEQRSLCLGGGYPTCPRFRDASSAKTVDARASAFQERAAEPVGRSDDVQGVPAVTDGLASHMSAASNMRSIRTTLDGERPNSLVKDERRLPRQRQPGTERRRRRLSRTAAGAGVSLAVLLLGVVFAFPAFSGYPRPTTSSPDAGQPLEPLATQALVSTTVATTALSTVAPTALPTVGPTANAAPQLAPPTPAPQPDVPPAGPRVVLGVRFAGGAGQDWLNNPPYASWSGGAYNLKANQPARFVAVGAPVDQRLGDVTVSATFHKTGGPPGGGYGLILRDQGPQPRDGVNQQANAYVFETGDLGEIGVWRRDGDRWVDLVGWTPSTSVRQGGSPNDLAARAIGDELTFTVNGTQVASVHDDRLPAGGVGIFVGGDYNEVAVDQFTVQVPN